MVSPFEDGLEQRLRRFRDEIDGYRDTVRAILAMLNFYFYNVGAKLGVQIRAVQGRRLRRFSAREEPAAQSPVVPDFAVAVQGSQGIVGEVKRSLPQDRRYWRDVFDQLLSYDCQLAGWPTEDGAVATHEITLVVHQSRAVAVRDFYEREREGGQVTFTRPFSIIEFNRSDERQTYFFFRTQFGELAQNELADRLRLGVQVPMDVLLRKYPTVELYDGPPPLPLLMQLIWAHVVTPKAAAKGSFRALRKRQKLELDLEIEEMVSVLRKGFSFASFLGYQEGLDCPVPAREWVVGACEKFIEGGDALWLSVGKTTVRFLFQKHDDVLDHCLRICAQKPADDKGQGFLFVP